jgi:hypothetical protein
MDGTTPTPAGTRKPRRKATLSVLSHEEADALIGLNERLQLEINGFTTAEVKRLVFWKWLYRTGRVSERRSA